RLPGAVAAHRRRARARTDDYHAAAAAVRGRGHVTADGDLLGAVELPEVVAGATRLTVVRADLEDVLAVLHAVAHHLDEGARRREHLPPFVTELGDDHLAAGRIDDDVDGLVELAGTRPGGAEYVQERARRAELLNAIVTSVGDVDVVDRIHGDPVGIGELP